MDIPFGTVDDIGIFPPVDEPVSIIFTQDSTDIYTLASVPLQHMQLGVSLVLGKSDEGLVKQRLRLGTMVDLCLDHWTQERR